MIVKGKTIANELRATWPAIYLPWITDKKFIAPTLKEVETAIKLHEITFLKNIDNICECEDFADQLAARIHWQRIQEAQNNTLPKNELYSWAFGIAFGTKFYGWPDDHYLNICYTKKGFYLIEPQTNDFWKPNNTDDHIVIVKM